MRILLVGATGFIGRHVCARLLHGGHQVVGAVRDSSSMARRFPGTEAVRIDLNRMTSASDWRPLLSEIDAVVNCAGILQGRPGQSAPTIHTASPIALFDACLAAGVRRVVQISAISADIEAGTEYALTKKAADDHLRRCDLDWTVLRPSLVHAQGSYGGTSLIRGLAALPFAVLVVGAGNQKFQPIHADDLAETVARCLDEPALIKVTLDPVGPETLSMRDILLKTRAWLDMPPAPVLGVPLTLVRAIARVGDVLGNGPLTTTAIDQLEYGNVSDPADFRASIGFRPRSMTEGFLVSPSHVQDRWHARLYFLGPLLTAILAALWLVSGIAGLAMPPAAAAAIAMSIGIPASLAVAAFCLLDLAIGIVLVSGRAGIRTGILQLAVVSCYTIGLTITAPGLWLEPYGALLKNLPVMAAVAVWMVLQDAK